MKKDYLVYLLGTFLAIQGASIYSAPQRGTLDHLVEQLGTTVRSGYRTLNRQTLLYYLTYWYPSLVRFLTGLTLESPEIIEMVQELIDIESIDSYFSTAS